MTRTVLVCCGTGCIATGSLSVAEALRGEIQKSGADATVETVIKETGCNGFCENGPIVNIVPDDVSYYKVKPKDAPDIVKGLGGEPVRRLLYRVDGKPVPSQKENPFYAPQHKIALRNIGIIDPAEISDYIGRGGYEALQKALAMTPDEIIGEVEASGLRGRGGAGFSTGRKWRIAAGYESNPKYVVCNGDEGDPGAFMDRSILEGDPHTVLEGMAICALAIGAAEGFLYIRDEYGLALKHMEKAIRDAEDKGILGDKIMGSDKSLRLTVVRGGGAFVCGESTALMASIEGRVGEPRAKYIRSVQRGLWDQPTVLNNVETLANIPVIINEGGEAFARIGAPKSKGTKVFALVGKVKRTGLIEVPMGVTLRHLIYDIGGGVIGDRPFKAVQTGGPSGGCIPADMLDLPVDFDTLTSYGAMMGSGGLIVMDDRSCMVEVARYYANFLAGESCGKCTPCREGLRQMLIILTDICEGRGKDGDVTLLEEISATMLDSSLCALGKSAPNPVLTTIKYFRDEYDAHIGDKRCPAGVCPKLTAFEVDPALCTGCTLCKRTCPVGAISGELKTAHEISESACTACGVCREACRFDAIITAPKRRCGV
ncbi:MAG: 4Fe-4S binding protein [Oscillospiraceae bacterium]|nr:4Fe-4S binding protein [Oscillospiraceae bacterium]